MDQPATDQPLSAGALYSRYAVRVAAFLRQRGLSPQQIEDVVQETFLVAHAQDGYKPGPARPFTWLAAIAVRVAAAHRRRLREHDEREPPGATDFDDAGRTPIPMLEAGEAVRRLQRLIGRLTPVQQRIVALVTVDGRSCSSIAQELGVTVSSVYATVHSVRRLLRETPVARTTTADQGLSGISAARK